MPETIALPPLERPRPARLPEIQRRLEEAAGLRREGEDLISKSESATTAANILQQKISSLESERTAIQQRLAGIEGRDLKAALASNRARIHQLYGKPALTAAESHDLNIAVASLAWFPLLEKEVVVIKKDLQSRLVEIEKELSNLTAAE